MYREMLLAQWRSSRAAVLVFVVLGFAAPLATVFYAGDLSGAGSNRVISWLGSAELVGRAMPVLALFAGVFLAMASWAPDHAGKHVYALSLPVRRSHYVLLRFGTGAALLVAPIAALGLGAFVASLAVDLPTGLHAYPLQLTARFALATLTCFAVFFAISVATKRALLLTLGAIGGIALADLLLKALGQDSSVAETVIHVLTTWPGPLTILLGRWALFDV